jgi:hypothetical protein
VISFSLLVAFWHYTWRDAKTGTENKKITSFMQNNVGNINIAVLVGRDFLLYGFSMLDILCFYPCLSKVAKFERNNNCACVESRNPKAFVYSRDVNAHAKINTCRYSRKNAVKIVRSKWIFNLYRSNVHLYQMCSPSYQVQLRAQIDTSLCNVLRWFSSSSYHPAVSIWNLNTTHFLKPNFDLIIGIHNYIF